MLYAMLIYESEAGFARRTDPAARDAYWSEWKAFGPALREAGVMAGGNALQAPTTATTLRFAGDERLVQDGPFADTKEQIGGFVCSTCPIWDAALDWAARAPRAGAGAGTAAERAAAHLTAAMDARQAVERVARESRARLVAFLAGRAVGGHTDWRAIATLYGGLMRLAPTIGAEVGRGAAVAEAEGAAAGWALLQAIPPDAVAACQPYWALARAIGLCEDQAARAFLVRRAAAVRTAP